jgi:GTP-binding protein
VRRADVVMLLIDATEPISEPDRKLAQYVAEEFKPVLLVINKWDLAKESFRAKQKLGDSEIVDDRELMEKYREYVDKEVPYLDFAPMVFVTAREGRNVQTAVDQAQHLFNMARHRMTTGRLNHAVRDILIEKAPSTPYGRKAKVYFAAQIDVNPPTIVLVVNNPDFFDQGYRRFLVRRLRDLLPYSEVPIRVLLNPRGQRTTERSLEEVDNEDELNKERNLPSTRPVLVGVGTVPAVPGAPAVPAVKGPRPRRDSAPRQTGRQAQKPRPTRPHHKPTPRAQFRKSGRNKR